MQWHQLDHMQTICTSLLTDNHANTSSLNFYRLDALPDAQPTVSKHWRQKEHRGKTVLKGYLLLLSAENISSWRMIVNEAACPWIEDAKRQDKKYGLLSTNEHQGRFERFGFYFYFARSMINTFNCCMNQWGVTLDYLVSSSTGYLKMQSQTADCTLRCCHLGSYFKHTSFSCHCICWDICANMPTAA